MQRLETNHQADIQVFGDNTNILRLTGSNETSSYDRFTHGIGDRTASVRIPYSTKNDNKGYLEDRRPASNMDPYVVTSRILKTCLE